MKKYLTFAHRQLAAHPGSRALKTKLDGKTVWIKQTVPSKANHWHGFQKFIAGVFHQPILRSTVNPGGSKGLNIEVRRLRHFTKLGFHVPQVLAADHTLVVLTDLGQELRKVLDDAPEPKRRKLIAQAATLLAEVHNRGLAHGRPFLRDMTWDGKQIGLLDLEEDPATAMPLVDAQARDIWLFLNAVSRYAVYTKTSQIYNTEVLDIAFNAYLAKAHNRKVLPALENFMAFLQPFKFILTKLWWRRAGKGLRQAIYATDYLQKHLGAPHNHA